MTKLGPWVDGYRIKPLNKTIPPFSRSKHTFCALPIPWPLKRKWSYPLSRCDRSNQRSFESNSDRFWREFKMGQSLIMLVKALGRWPGQVEVCIQTRTYMTRKIDGNVNVEKTRNCFHDLILHPPHGWRGASTTPTIIVTFSHGSDRGSSNPCWWSRWPFPPCLWDLGLKGLDGWQECGSGTLNLKKMKNDISYGHMIACWQPWLSSRTNESMYCTFSTCDRRSPCSTMTWVFGLLLDGLQQVLKEVVSI